MEYTSKAMINSGTAFRLLQKAKDEQYEIIDLSGLKIREMPMLLIKINRKILLKSESFSRLRVSVREEMIVS